MAQERRKCVAVCAGVSESRKVSGNYKNRQEKNYPEDYPYVKMGLCSWVNIDWGWLQCCVTCKEIELHKGQKWWSTWKPATLDSPLPLQEANIVNIHDSRFLSDLFISERWYVETMLKIKRRNVVANRYFHTLIWHLLSKHIIGILKKSVFQIHPDFRAHPRFRYTLQ